jgi:hypothetical protein
MLRGKETMPTPPIKQRKLPSEANIFLGLLGLALYGVYFRGFTDMGLYEDDWSAIAPYANATWSETWAQVQQWLTHWPNGRPLGLSICALSAWGLYNLGGMAAIYLLPFGIVLAGSYMVYRILRATQGALPAFFGAITFALLPTDTLRLSLHATPHLHLAILFLLFAIRAAQRGHNWAVALFVFFGLLFHESATLTAFLVPLLFLTWTKAHLWRTLQYWSYALAALVAVFCLRVFVFAESRASETFTSLNYVFERSLISLTTGTLTHWSLLGQRCREAIQFQVPGSLFSFTLILLILLGVLVWKRLPDRQATAEKESAMITPLNAIMFGILAMSVPYLVYFTAPYWPANHQAGRIASVHSASGVGFSFIVAGVCGFIHLLPRAWSRWIGIAALAIPLAALLSWGNVVRLQYLDAWQNQRYYWNQMLDHLGNIKANTIIFSLRENYWTPPFTWVIGSNSWADSIVLSHIYQFPPEWPRTPRVFTIVGPWQGNIRAQDGQLYWHMPAGDWPPLEVPLEPGNLMIFTNTDGKPVPMEGEIELAGQRLKLMSPSQGNRPSFKSQPLFRDLTGNIKK